MAAGDCWSATTSSTGVVKERLNEHDWNYGFIIDGFPRNERQAEFFLESYDIDGVIHLDLPDAEVKRRVLARRLCDGLRDGLQPHRVNSPRQRRAGATPAAASLIRREDDTEEALAVRLREYHQKTNPGARDLPPQGVRHHGGLPAR